ncbi:hypothetical protein B1759_16700 [Rubrivirga sp. SAORIC476]|uniref:hypothetical protein n=1 Tax=Rubrivirga sp. SAORIC476 TaxID=1961794 RepID=UPI000BA95AF2|nr:hypothetical protein [Rubrivirga sp. SAORIC476]PAP74815.1 hypothetical protein B1759_16700 [Rubrivirga sp. SAORIC476]
MFDTLRIFWETPHAEGVLCRIEHVERETWRGRPAWRGPIGHLRVFVCPPLVSVSFEVGRIVGAREFDTATAHRLIDFVSDEVGESVHDASLTRVDTSANLDVTEPAEHYLGLLIYAPHLSLHREAPASVRLSNKTRALLYYDPYRKRGIESGAHVVRVEHQVKKNVGRVLKWDRPRLATLADPAFRALCAERLDLAHRLVRAVPGVRRFDGVEDVRDVAAANYFAGCPEDVLRALAAVDAAPLSLSRKRRQRDRILSALPRPSEPHRHPLLCELDHLVATATSSM